MSRPIVAIIANALTPYRLHFHRRLVRELSEYEWWSLFTHDVSNAPWNLADEKEIRPVRFGQGERADDQARFSRAIHECRKGGRIIQWLREHQVTAVVLLGYNDCGRLRILHWCHRHQLPCFLFGDSNVRGDSNSGFKGKLKRWLLPRILKKCAGVLACGSLGRAYFRRYGVPDDRIFYMPYEPDYEMIAGLSENDIQKVISEYGLAVGRDYMIYCGRLVSVKRVDLLMDAFAAVAADRPNWDLIIVGDGPLRQALINQLPESLRQRVHWLGFINDQRAIAALQRGAKVLVLPSDFEPWGVVVNEGTAANCVIIATEAVGAAAELVSDGVNGRIIPCGDSRFLASAILETTHSDNIDRMRSASAEQLIQWRKSGDPVAGLQAALDSVRPRNVVS